MKIFPLASFAIGLFTVLAACSSSSSSPVTSSVDSGISDTGTAPTDVAIDVIIDNSNCVAPGTVGNADGIGGYCSPGGGQCDHAGPLGAARICSADTGVAPAHAWFCTYPCTMDSDCGTGASCISTTAGQGCLPTSCVGLEADSGLLITGDASTDAGTTTVTDGSSDSAAAAD